MSNDQYNTSEPKCNIKKRSHENVINDSGDLAKELARFGVWLGYVHQTVPLSDEATRLIQEGLYNLHDAYHVIIGDSDQEDRS